MEDLIVRKALLKDTYAISKFNIKMAKETENIVLDLNVVYVGVKSIINDPHKGFYVVAEKLGTGIIGQLMITFEWSDWKNKWLWWIQSLYVEKEFRKQKVFTKLLNKIIILAESQTNVYGLKLYVKKENKIAQKIYVSSGMQKLSYDIFELKIKS